METKLRSLIKTLTWRVTGTVITFILAFIFSQDLTKSAFVGITDTFVKLFAQFIHERIWNYVRWGYEMEPVDLADLDYDEEALPPSPEPSPPRCC